MTITSSSTTDRLAAADQSTPPTTVTRQESVTLDASMVRQGHNQIIYATTVTIKKGFVNPGRDLTIHAARVVVDSGGGTIDVSGAPGQGFAEGARRDGPGRKDNSYDGANGFDGQPGGGGAPGGNVTLYAESITGGKLEIASRGGAGGRAQDGGNGFAGAQPEPRVAVATPKLIVVDRKFEVSGPGRGVWKDVYGWGGDVQKIGSDWWGAELLVAHQAEGGLGGGNGGHAGLAGRAGDGGRGGAVTVRAFSKYSTTVRADAAGGAKGAAAKHGQPGRGAAGGLGGEYKYKSKFGFVDIDWSTWDGEKRWDEYWNTRNATVNRFKDLGVNSAYVLEDSGQKKLKARANSGVAGRGGGYGAGGGATAPRVETANDGPAGSFAQNALDASGAPFRDAPLAYALMLQRSAAAAEFDRDAERAAGILRWLMIVTAAYRHLPPDPSDEAKQRQAIHLDAEQALLTRTRDATAADRAARCAQTDIAQYSTFVDKSLEHAEHQEDLLAGYQRAAEKLAERKRALDDAIADAEEHARQLTGDSLTPGSILYYQAKEQELKESIGTLDLQLVDYRYRLEHMERALQDEIDAKIRAESAMSVWTVLEFVGMAAGIAMNFASAAGSIKTMIDKVKDFYKTSLDLDTVGEILKDGIWNREFSVVKSELAAFLETKEWEKVDKARKAFVTSVTDFQAKIAAYDAILASRKTVSSPIDPLDVQASVLVFDTAKLGLKKQRTDFEAFIVKFLEEYEEARTWKHLFTDYFDTADTRFDMLAHLADVQASRRDLEYQLRVQQRTLALLTSQRSALDFDPAAFDADDVRTSLEASLNLAIGHALDRIHDEQRAYAIWTLQTHRFPALPANVDAKKLRAKFHEPLWEKINDALSKATLPAHRDFGDTPFVWTRAEYPAEFDQFDTTGRMIVTVPADPESNIYFERLTDAKVLLRGARIAADSAFYCTLKHHGISHFVDRDRGIVTCYQQPRSIEFSYRLVGDVPDYAYEGAIRQSFDAPDGIARIRYSPYATWEIFVPIDYVQSQHRSRVYNKGLKRAEIGAIELRVSAFFSSRHVPRLKRSTRKDS